MSIMVSTGRGANLGVLFKNAESIELMRKVTTLVVDKTGTLSEVRPKLVTVKPENDIQETIFLSMIASLEKGSEHPLAQAIVNGVKEKGITLLDVSEFESVTGKGVKGIIDNKMIALGNKALMSDLNISIDHIKDCADEFRKEGQTIMFVATENIFAGIIGVADPIKETTVEAISNLHDLSLIHI